MGSWGAGSARQAAATHAPRPPPRPPALQAALADTAIVTPRIPVISNVDAQPHSDPETIKRILVQQLSSPVQVGTGRWAPGTWCCWRRRPLISQARRLAQPGCASLCAVGACAGRRCAVLCQGSRWRQVLQPRPRRCPPPAGHCLALILALPPLPTSPTTPTSRRPAPIPGLGPGLLSHAPGWLPPSSSNLSHLAYRPSKPPPPPARSPARLQWETTLKTLLSKGLVKSTEVGPGKVIAGIMKRIDKKAEISNVVA
jgi:hypothetical protein